MRRWMYIVVSTLDSLKKKIVDRVRVREMDSPKNWISIGTTGIYIWCHDAKSEGEGAELTA